MDDIPAALRPLDVLSTYSPVYGQQNVVVIDYMGTVAAGINIVEVIFCEIFGVLCTRPELFDAAERVNRKSSLVEAQAYALFRVNSATEQNCQPCLARQKDLHGHFHEAYQLRLLSFPVPVVHPNITHLHAHAKHMDRDVHALYGGRMLHPDPHANRHERMKHMRVEDLDQHTLLADVAWRRWLEEQRVSAVQAGRFR